MLCPTAKRVLANNTAGGRPSCGLWQVRLLGLAGWGLNYGGPLGPVCVQALCFGHMAPKGLRLYLDLW